MPQSLCARVRPAPSPQALHLSIVSPALPFAECRRAGIPQAAAFSDWLLAGRRASQLPARVSMYSPLFSIPPSVFFSPYLYGFNCCKLIKKKQKQQNPLETIITATWTSDGSYWVSACFLRASGSPGKLIHRTGTPLKPSSKDRACGPWPQATHTAGRPACSQAGVQTCRGQSWAGGGHPCPHHGGDGLGRPLLSGSGRCPAEAPAGGSLPVSRSRTPGAGFTAVKP